MRRCLVVLVIGDFILMACAKGPAPGPGPEDGRDAAIEPDAAPTDTGDGLAETLDVGLEADDAFLVDDAATVDDVFTPDASLPPLDLSERLAPGQVRAGRVAKKEDLIGGRTAKGGIGDYKIYNSRVAFIIEDSGLASGYKRYGGVPVDADAIRPEGEAGRSQMGEMFFGFNLRLFEPLEVVVVSDGRDSDRALIRVRGRDVPFPWLSSFLQDLLPAEPIGCEITYDFSLGPDDEFLTWEVSIANTSSAPLDLVLQVANIIGDGLQPHLPGPGFNSAAHQGRFLYWAAMGDAVSYGLLAEEGPIEMAFHASNVAFGFYPDLTVPPGETRILRRYLAVTSAGLDEIARIFRRLRPAGPIGTVTGQVEADPEALRRGVRVHVLSPKGDHLSVVRPGPDGSFSSEFEPGSYRFLAKADGFEPSPEAFVTVVANQESQVALAIPPSTAFDYTVTSNQGLPVPARLSFFRKDGPPTNILPAKFGEESHPVGAALVVFSGTGEGNGVVPRGTYDVWATRGPEYERDYARIEAGEAPLSLAFHVEHVVDSAGYVSTDTHIHAEHSPDTSIAEDLRVRTALADGLEVPVLTEHDVIYDLAAATAAIPGATSLVKFIAGSEVTTYMYGHFNAFPLTPKPHLINNGGIEWFGTWAPDLFTKIRNSEDHPVVIQVNHPRGADIGSYFSAVGLNRDSGTIRVWSNWSDDFDAIEVFNGGCYNGNTEVLLDWFDFLNRGYRFSVSGASDTHSEHGIGFPRVYIPTEDSVADFDPQALVRAFRDLAVFVSCGPFVRFEIDQTGPGGLVSEPGPVEAVIEVQAPSWMAFKDLRILRNGVEVFALPAEEWTPGEGAVRFSDLVTLPPTEADAWYVLEVRGTGDLWPLHWGAPYAITNPIFVDANGNGVFDAPLPAYQPLHPD